jgi:hypothetical protein
MHTLLSYAEPRRALIATTATKSFALDAAPAMYGLRGIHVVCFRMLEADQHLF